MPLAPRATTPRGRRIALNVLLGAAIVDAVFLAGLVIALVAGSSGAVEILGPLYLFGFVYLLYLAATGAMQRNWGWRFFGIVAVTLGPAGAIWGARRMRAETDAQVEAEKTAPRPTRKEQRRAATEKRRAR
jgi:protein-S-isoprenylcysteine O-methyltransferase Ste14